MTVSRGFISEFITEAGRYLERAEACVHAIAGRPYLPIPIQDGFHAMHSFTGGACFLGLDRAHRLARTVESALDALHVRTLPCSNEQGAALLRALVRLRELIGALSHEADVTDDDAQIIEELRQTVTSLLAQSDDYRPSTSTVVRMIRVEIEPASDIFPPEVPNPGRPGALEPRITRTVRSDRPAMAALERLLSLPVGDWGAVEVALEELGQQARAWPPPALDLLVRMRDLGERIEIGHPDAIGTFSQLLALAGDLRQELVGSQLTRAGASTGDIIETELTPATIAIVESPDATARVARPAVYPVALPAASRQPAAASQPPAAATPLPVAMPAPRIATPPPPVAMPARADADTLSFCREATGLLEAIESVVHRSGRFQGEDIEAVTEAFGALGDTAAERGLARVEAVARRLQRDLLLRHLEVDTSPDTQRILATAGIDALRVLIERLRLHGCEAGGRGRLVTR